MTVKLNVKRGEGMMFSTLFRKIAINTIEEYRPIAYHIDDEGSNLLYSNNIAQDMLQFIASLDNLKFESNVKDDLVVLNVTLADKLYSEDLKSSEIRCVTNGVLLFNNIGDNPINIKLIFRRYSGICSVEDNQNFLLDRKLLGEGFDIKVIRSNHGVIKSMKQDITQVGLNKELLSITIQDKHDKINEKEFLNKVIDVAISRLQKMKMELNNEN